RLSIERARHFAAVDRQRQPPVERTAVHVLREEPIAGNRALREQQGWSQTDKRDHMLEHHLSSEHAVRVGRFSRYRLADVPQFDDAVAVEAENVDHRCAEIAGTLPHVRMHGDEVAVLERAQYREALL